MKTNKFPIIGYLKNVMLKMSYYIVKGRTGKILLQKNTSNKLLKANRRF